MPKFPHLRVHLDLDGPGGNVFAVIGNVKQALKAAGEREAANEFAAEAMRQPSYEAVLDLVGQTVDADIDRVDEYA